MRSRYLLILVNIVFVGVFPTHAAYAQVSCESIFAPKLTMVLRPKPALTKEALAAGKFLYDSNKALAKIPAVRRQSPSQPAEKIASWLQDRQKRHAKLMAPIEERDRNLRYETLLRRIKAIYFKQHTVSAENVPQGFFDARAEVQRQLGHGETELSVEERLEIARTASADQKRSLEAWIDYFLSPDSSSYPTWVKFWALTNILKLSKYDPETQSFAARSRGSTMAMYPEVNRAAFAKLNDVIIKKVHGDSLASLTEPSLLPFVEKLSFAKLYGRALHLETLQRFDLSSTDGKWLTFPKGSDYQPLVKSIDGMNTGWCTAGEYTAQEQIAKGDLHVFYTRDDHGDLRVPRVAIRQEDEKILEVRGVALDQNVDGFIAGSDVLDRKLKEFGAEGEAFLKRSADMKRVTEIEKRVRKGGEFSQSDLRFLYEIDGPILGFGYAKDPRIFGLLLKRNHRRDISVATGHKESEISLSKEEFLAGGRRVHYGELIFDESDSLADHPLPEILVGGLEIDAVKLKDRLVVPKGVTSLTMPSLMYFNDIQLAPDMRGTLSFGVIEHLRKNLVIPKGIVQLYMGDLQSLRGLKLHPEMTGKVTVGVTSLPKSGFTVPRGIRNFNANNLRHLAGLKLHPRMRGLLFLNAVDSVEEGFSVPPGVLYLSMNSLVSPRGLILDPEMRGHISLAIESTDGVLVIPKGIDNLQLSKLDSPKGLMLHPEMSGVIWIKKIRHDNPHLKVPPMFRGTIHFEDGDVTY